MDKSIRKLTIKNESNNLKNSDENISVEVWETKRAKSCAILCHGLQSSKNSTKLHKIVHTLHKRKITPILFDFYGHGQSDGNPKKLTIGKQIENIQTVFNFAEKEYGFKSVNLIGVSLGATASFLYSALNPNVVTTLTAIVPRFNFYENTMSNFPLYNKSAMEINFPLISANIKSKVAFVIADEDEIVDNIISVNLFHNLKTDQKDCYFIEGATHRLASKFSINCIVDIIKKTVDDEEKDFTLVTLPIFEPR